MNYAFWKDITNKFTADLFQEIRNRMTDKEEGGVTINRAVVEEILADIVVEQSDPRSTQEKLEEAKEELDDILTHYDG